MLQRNEKIQGKAATYNFCMSLKNIKLPINVIANLYPASLVSLHASKKTIKSIVEKIKFLGLNEKQVTILVKEENAAFLSDSSLTFLMNILKACKLNLSDVAIVNTLQIETKDYTFILNCTNARVVLLFGVSPPEIQLPLNFPYFQVQLYDHTTYLYAPDLNKVENEPSLKGQLWSGLQEVFQLS